MKQRNEFEQAIFEHNIRRESLVGQNFIENSTLSKGESVGNVKFDKIAQVLREFKDGKLHSSSGDKVTDKDQALAIALSEAGMNKGDYVKMDKDAFVKEHKDLIDILQTGTEKERKQEAQEQKEEMKDLKKSISLMDDYLEKGGKKATIGEVRDFGKRKYIKTASGWKYHGKGTGAKAKAHKKEAEKHSKKSKKEQKEALPKPKKDDRFTVRKLTNGKYGVIDRDTNALMDDFTSKERAVKDMMEENKKHRESKQDSGRSKASQNRIDRAVKMIDQYEELSEQEINIRNEASTERRIGSSSKADRLDRKADKIEEKMSKIDDKIQELGQKMTEDEREEAEAHYGLGDLFNEPLQEEKGKGKSDVKVTGRKYEPGTMNKKEARKANGRASAANFHIPSVVEVYEDNLKDMRMQSRISQLNDSLEFVENDKYRPPHRQKVKGDHSKIEKKLKELQKEYIGTTEVNTGKDTLKVTPEGNLYVNGNVVQITSSAVKLGGGVRGASTGALYSGDYFDGQLQGIVHSHAANKLRGLVAEGNSWKDINEKMNEGRTVMSGTTYADEWPILKKHLGLK